MTNFTAADFDFRLARNLDSVVAFANELAAAQIPARSCDPIQAWQAHPVISKHLHLSDRAIAAVIDKVFPLPESKAPQQGRTPLLKKKI
jgi:hypothetical protein